MNTSLLEGLKNFVCKITSKVLPQKMEQQEISVADAVTKELDMLWTMIKEQKEEKQSLSDALLEEKLGESFAKLREKYSDDLLDGVYAWPRFVKVSIACDNPVRCLVEYVTEENYISLSKRLSDLSKSVCKGNDPKEVRNMERLSKAVCNHILENIDPTDVPSCLLLGQIAQKNGNYSEARQWFEKIVETNEPFNGITSILACYEEEIKEILRSGRRGSRGADEKEKVRELNRQQSALYEKWYRIMDEKSSADKVDEEFEKEYVTLSTRYARFERNVGHFEQSHDILAKVPRTYTDIYRVYAEEAMLYQYRPYKNRFYDLEKAIETFKKAYDLACETGMQWKAGPKSKKSILMPLANTYFESGKYDEADKVCDIVLKIDSREQRALNLKTRIADLAS